MNPLNVFPNARSRLFGEGENSIGIIVTPAVAGLSGSLTLDPTIQSKTEIVGAGFNQNVTISSTTGLGVGVVIVTAPSLNAVVGEKILITYVWISEFNGNVTTGQARHSLERNGSVVSSFDTPNFTGEIYRTFQFIDNVPVVGSNTYRIVIGSLGNNEINFQYVSLTPTLISATDTHAGFIDTVAIAGKQINAPDSHTTHELAVLPG